MTSPEAIDADTFAAIWSEHATRIEAWLRPRVGQDAADLTQDTFLRAWRIRDQYDPSRGPVIAWLHVIAASVCADHFRAAGRRPATVDFPDGYEAADVADVAAQVCDQIDATAVLERVPARDRELLARRYLADQPVATVAAELATPAGTVKSRCHKALTALRAALGVVTPVVPRTADPAPDVAPATIPAARSTTVAQLDPRPGVGRGRCHRPDPRRHRRPPATRRCAHPHGPPRHPALVHATARRGAPAPPVRAVPAGADPLRRRPRHQRRHEGVPACPYHVRQGGDEVMMTMTPDQFGWAALPWMLAVAVMFTAIIWALIVDDGTRTHRRRDAERAMERFGWTRYAPGRSTAATETAVIDRIDMPTAFAPEPPPVDPDSPIGGDREGGEPEPVEQPTPAGRAWPVPELLPQPNPDPVAAMLFDATGAYPTLDETVLHSGVTGAFPRLTDEVLAAFDAALKAGAR